MKIFEIKKQVGWARLGKFAWNNQTFNTPQLLWPVHVNFNDFVLQAIKLPSDKKGILPGYEIDDILQLSNSFIRESANSDRLEKYTTPIFLESLELFGVPSKTTTESQIIILKENFPNISTFRYREYEKEIFKLRMDLYEKWIFPNFKAQAFIFEIRISEWEEKLDLFIDFVQKHISQIVGIKLTGFFDNLGNFQQITDWIGKMKKTFPPDILWIAGGQIYPPQYCLATYLGFDLIDTAILFIRGSEGLYLGNDERIWIRDLRVTSCGCYACEELNQILPSKLTEISQSYITRHNIWLGWTEMKRVYASLDAFTIRTLLEEKIHSETYSASFLRILDKKYNSDINIRFPLISDHPVKCIGPESYSRAEVENYILRLQENITPGRDYRVIILLPCASKKPYSKSQSHQRFMKAIRKGAGRANQYVHQVIVTSPMGVIPRELENVFPIQHYDIPVTGDWDHTEIDQCASAIVNWVEKYNPMIKIIAHVSGGYKKAVEKAEHIIRSKIQEHNHFKFIYTMSNSSLSVQSDEALEFLEKIILQSLEATVNENHSLNKSQNLSDSEILIRATADYQFGKGVGDLFLEHGAFIIQGKNPLFDTVFAHDGAGKRQLGNLFHSTGMMKLSLAGAEILSEVQGNDLSIDGKDINGTTVFRPILKNINTNLHPGDEIVIKDGDGNFLGMGELIIHPKDALNATSGAIAKIRKKISKQSTFDQIIENENIED